MKILLVGPPLKTLGGIQNYLELLINYLEDKKYKTEYFTQPMKSNKNIIFFFSFFLQYFKFFLSVKNKKPDIIHLNFSLILASVMRDFIFLKLSKIYNCNTILFIHGWRWGFFNYIKKSIFLSNVFKKNMNKSDKILVLSHAFKDALIEIGVDENKIFLTTTMVEFEKYNTLKKEFNEPLQILFCANMKKDKGPYTVLDSAPLVLDNFPTTKYVFVGAGKELDKLKQKTKLMNLDSNITFSGYVSLDEKQNIFKNSHLFVFPTEHAEGFPTVIPEAMASGMPIISTSIAGLKDALKNRKHGLIIESNPPNAEELAGKIIQLFKHKGIMKEISKNNISEAKKRYDINIVSKKIELIYLELIEQ